MKPYPQVSDLREPALRLALPHARRLVVGQELAPRPRRIQKVGLGGCPVLFFDKQWLLASSSAPRRPRAPILQES